jgi:hypothetical protein
MFVFKYFLTVICYLQIFYLDNIELGIFNLPHNSMPRIANFDEIKLRRMILMCCNPDKNAYDYASAPVNSIFQFYKFINHDINDTYVLQYARFTNLV